jgi:cellulose synthase/poly-beta-1,6-N-acetylglucosamine synthase-like glycosyltransferase
LLKSLIDLEYDSKKIEVIIVDGDKSGETEKIASAYPFTVVKDEAKGLNRARNIGLKNSICEIVAFTDDDCVVSRDWTLRIAESFLDPSVGFVGGRVLGYAKGELLSSYVDETIVPIMPRFKEKVVTRKLRRSYLPAGCNMAFRRTALEKINFLDERISYGFDDIESVERIAEAGFNLVLDPKVLIFHRHRVKLREFLKQNFRYGRGGMLYLLAGTKSYIHQSLSNYLVGVFSGLMILGLPLLATIITGNHLFIMVTMGLSIAPWLSLMGVYARRFKDGNKLKRIFLYPLLDILRGLSFAFGALYQFLSRRR